MLDLNCVICAAVIFSVNALFKCYFLFLFGDLAWFLIN